MLHPRTRKARKNVVPHSQQRPARLSEFEVRSQICADEDDVTLTTPCTQSRPQFIMNSLRVARAALRVRPAAFRVPVQRRGYAEAVSDKASSSTSQVSGTASANIASRSSLACRSPTRYDFNCVSNRLAKDRPSRLMARCACGVLNC